MADAADDKKSSDSAASDDTLLATPGSSGGGKPVQADASALEIDHSDRYALGEVHAAGGLGRIMRARDRRLHRTVAVKELLQHTPAAEARFVREALITAQLEHPGIVPVHDAGRWPTGEPYYSMKLVSGRTLRDLIQSRKELDARLALVPNAIAVAEAIAYAHSRDVIHRDIKPPNVLIGDFGETLVIDWGLAKDLTGRVAEPAPDPLTATATGSGSGDLQTAVGNVMGTPAYMSPEQARGEELDARADVYSLGALLYELLVGEPPHTGPSVQDVLASAQEGRVAPVEERQPDAPPDLCAIVTKAMAADRAERYPTAMEMAADLRRFQTGQLVTARHYSTPALVLRWVARHRAIVAVVVAAAAALAVVGVVSFRRVMAQRNRAETQMHIAEDARDELVFRQAEGMLLRDPTAALAWLKRYPIGGEHSDRLGALIDDATAAGVARHVLALPAWGERVTFTPDGELVTADRNRNLIKWDPATGESQLIRIHQGEPQVLFSPDGSSAAITHRDGTIELQPTRVGEPRRLLGLTGVAQMIFSADGRRLLASARGHMRVWDAATGAELLALDKEEGQFANLAPDGSRLYVARESGDIVEYAIGAAAGRAPKTALHLDSPAVWLVISPDGKQLLEGDTRDDVKLVDLASGKARLLGRHRIQAEGWMAFSHAGDRVALTPDDGTIVLYELATGAPRVLRGHEDPVFALVFSRDDSLLMSASDDGTARIWNLVAGEAQVLRGHTDDIPRLALSPDGKWLATASLDKTVRVWPVGAGMARVIPGGIKDAGDIAFVAGGTRLTAGNHEREAESFDLATGKSLEIRLEPWRADSHPMLGDSLVIAPDSEGGATLYDLTTGDARPLPPPGDDPVTAVGISKDDTRVVTVDESGAVLLWDVASGEPRPIPMERAPLQVQFLPGRREVALGGAGFLELWDLDNGRAVARAQLPALSTHTPGRIASSADGRVIASWGRDGEVMVWDTSSTATRVIDQGKEVQDVAVSPDGRLVALALGDRTVKLWDAATGEARIIGGHTDLVHKVAFSPDGRILASCAFDRTVRLWIVETGRARVLRGHGADVKAVAFSPDGKTLASIGADGTVRLWPLAALPDDRPAAVPARLGAATSAVVDRKGRALTPAREPAGPEI